MKDPQELLDRYRTGHCTDEERHLVESWLLGYRATEDPGLTEADYRRIRNENWPIIRQMTVSKTERSRLRWWPYAAAALLLLGVAAWLLERDPGISPSNLDTNATVIQPGGHKATLTLADGRALLLDESQSGITLQGQYLNYGDGSVLDSISGVPQLLTLRTPKGGTYSVTLPDGSTVWLNAESALTYPSHFGAEAREVLLEGEGYFDIKAKHTHPFHVRSSDQLVAVLGTAFNISAYAHEAVATTLISGSVQVRPLSSRQQHAISAPEGAILVPGQQAIHQGGDLRVNTVDTGVYTAWREGKFVFEQEPLESIMTKLARWYDVEIVYAGDKSYGTFTGSISRQEHIEAILDKIRFTQTVNFKIEGRRITVM